MNAVLIGCHVVLALTMPIIMLGLINRTKALWAGRKGQRILQVASDLMRLLKKRSVYSNTTTALFRGGAWVVLVTTLMASLVSPMFGTFAPIHFDRDFIAFAYTLGLGRVALMLSGMDVGSAFEGMGTVREASFSAFAEPGFILLLGAAAIATGTSSFAAMLGGLHSSPNFVLFAVPAVCALFILLQTEAARVPVDDPLTHLELTMIHEVMILDHSGPELAAMQYAAGLKLTLYAGMIAAVLNPFDPSTATWPCIGVAVLIMALVAVAVGSVESLIARLRMQWVPRYVLAVTVAAVLCLAAVGWGGGIR